MVCCDMFLSISSQCCWGREPCFTLGMDRERRGHAIFVVRNFRFLLHPEGGSSWRSGLRLLALSLTNHSRTVYLVILVHVWGFVLFMSSYHLLWGLGRSLRRERFCISSKLTLDHNFTSVTTSPFYTRESCIFHKHTCKLHIRRPRVWESEFHI
jgi:hypothetical protein